MRHSLGLAFLLALTASPAWAQGTFLLPSKAGVSQPGAIYRDSAPQSHPFWSTSGTSTWGRAQYLYAMTDVAAPAGLLNGLAIRQPTGYRQAANTFTSTIMVSQSPALPTTASSTFASNHGPNMVTVFQGQLNLPATSSTAWPTPWQPVIPFSQTVPFSTAGGGSLVVDFTTTAATMTRSWVTEGYQLEAGNSTSELFRPSCLNSTGGRSGSWSWSPNGLIPGGSFLLNLNGYPNNQPTLATNALFAGLSGLGSQVGPFTTPFPLSSLGFPAAANCEFGIGILDGFPMQYMPSNSTTPNRGSMRLSNVPIPNNPQLAGLSLFFQNVALDGSQLYSSSALKFTIGTGNTIPATRVASLASAPRPTGSVTRSNAVSLQLHY